MNPNSRSRLQAHAFSPLGYACPLQNHGMESRACPLQNHGMASPLARFGRGLSASSRTRPQILPVLMQYGNKAKCVGLLSSYGLIGSHLGLGHSHVRQHHLNLGHSHVRQHHLGLGHSHVRQHHLGLLGHSHVRQHRNKIQYLHAGIIKSTTPTCTT